RLAGGSAIALLHCVSAYPVPPGSENLSAIRTLAETFSVPAGLSDHGSDGSSLPLAVAAGASLYERHVVLAKGDGSIDSAVSSDPAELAALIRGARLASAAMGSGVKECMAVEAPNRSASRRSLYALRSVRAGAVVAEADVIALRPEAGLRPNRYHDLIGARLSRAVEAGTPFLETDVRPSETE